MKRREEEEEKEGGRWEREDLSAFRLNMDKLHYFFPRPLFSPPFSRPFLFRVNEVAWAMAEREKNSTPKKKSEGGGRGGDKVEEGGWSGGRKREK